MPACAASRRGQASHGLSTSGSTFGTYAAQSKPSNGRLMVCLPWLEHVSMALHRLEDPFDMVASHNTAGLSSHSPRSAGSFRQSALGRPLVAALGAKARRPGCRSVRTQLPVPEEGRHPARKRSLGTSWYGCTHAVCRTRPCREVPKHAVRYIALSATCVDMVRRRGFKRCAPCIYTCERAMLPTLSVQPRTRPHSVAADALNHCCAVSRGISGCVGLETGVATCCA